MPQLLGIIVILVLVINFWYIVIPIIAVAFIISYFSKEDKRLNKIRPHYSNESNYNVSNAPKYNQLKASNNNIAFYSKHDELNLFGYIITNSMFYVSESKTDLPFVIDKKNSPSFTNTNVSELGYWPNYNHLNATQKGNFIKWLAEGKKSSVMDLGYVYLYYYGLEYRALVEKQDLKEVLFEVISLVTTYPRLSYAYEFIAYLVFKVGTFSESEKEAIYNFLNNNSNHYNYSKYFNNLKQKVSNDKTEYLLALTPIQFLNDNEYWDFSGRFGELLDFYCEYKINKLDQSDLCQVTSKTMTYRMAMNYYYSQDTSFEYQAVLPSSQAKRLWSRCIKILREEKSVIRKFDSSSASLNLIEKYTYLPPKLRAEIEYPEKINLEEAQIKTVAEILDILGLGNTGDKLTQRQSEFLADALDALGYAIEPDARQSKKPYRAESFVSVYKNLMKNDYYGIYSTAALFLDLGYKMALEDSELLEVETKFIKEFINKNFELNIQEKLRLEKRAELILHTKEINNNDIIKKLISDNDTKTVDMIANFLIAVAAADDIMKSEELKLLIKTFKQFGLSEEYLNELLDNLSAENEPITIQKAQIKKKRGSAIPLEQEVIEKIEIKLDKEKISTIMLDTSQVQKTLHTIFAQEAEDEPAEETMQEIEVDSKILSLVPILLEKTHWSQAELMAIVQNKNMMLNSTIDFINEWSDEKYGDFLIEEDETGYSINEYVANLIKNKE